MQLRGQSSRQSSGRPIITAFAIWFAHFMVIWAAGEIWPYQWTANAWAWGVTAMALLAVGVHDLRVKARHANGELPGWSYRFARGAIASAATCSIVPATSAVSVLVIDCTTTGTSQPTRTLPILTVGVFLR